MDFSGYKRAGETPYKQEVFEFYQPDNLTVAPKEGEKICSPKNTSLKKGQKLTSSLEKLAHSITPDARASTLRRVGATVLAAAMLAGSVSLTGKTISAITSTQEHTAVSRQLFRPVVLDQRQILSAAKIFTGLYISARVAKNVETTLNEREITSQDASGNFSTSINGISHQALHHIHTPPRPVNINGVGEAATAAYLAGFRGSNLVIAVAIAGAESTWTNNAQDFDRNGTVDRGMWQINSCHPQFNPEQLLSSAVYNAKAAFDLSGGFNFQPWSTFNSGRYEAFMGIAQNAVSSLGKGL